MGRCNVWATSQRSLLQTGGARLQQVLLKKLFTLSDAYGCTLKMTVREVKWVVELVTFHGL